MAGKGPLPKAPWEKGFKPGALAAKPKDGNAARAQQAADARAKRSTPQASEATLIRLASRVAKAQSNGDIQDWAKPTVALQKAVQGYSKHDLRGALDRAGVADPKVRRILLHKAEGDNGVLGEIGSGVGELFGELSRPFQAVTSGLASWSRQTEKEANKKDGGIDLGPLGHVTIFSADPGKVLDAASQGWEGKRHDSLMSILDEAGKIRQKGHRDPGIFSGVDPTGGHGLGDSRKWNPIVRTAADLGAGIALDPLTWLSFGTTAGARGAVRTVAPLLAKIREGEGAVAAAETGAKVLAGPERVAAGIKGATNAKTVADITKQLLKHGPKAITPDEMTKLREILPKSKNLLGHPTDAKVLRHLRGAPGGVKFAGKSIPGTAPSRWAGGALAKGREKAWAALLDKSATFGTDTAERGSGLAKTITSGEQAFSQRAGLRQMERAERVAEGTAADYEQMVARNLGWQKRAEVVRDKLIRAAEKVKLTPEQSTAVVRALEGDAIPDLPRVIQEMGGTAEQAAGIERLAGQYRKMYTEYGKARIAAGLPGPVPELTPHPGILPDVASMPEVGGLHAATDAMAASGLEPKKIASSLLRQTRADVKKTGEGGFTYEILGSSAPTHGYAYSPYLEREARIPLAKAKPQDILDYADAHADLLGKDGHYIGGWVDDQGNIVLDVSVVEAADEATALERARQAGQEAVWSIHGRHEIPTGLTPDEVAAARQSLTGAGAGVSDAAAGASASQARDSQLRDELALAFGPRHEHRDRVAAELDKLPLSREAKDADLALWDTIAAQRTRAGEVSHPDEVYQGFSIRSVNKRRFGLGKKAGRLEQTVLNETIARGLQRGMKASDVAEQRLWYDIGHEVFQRLGNYGRDMAPAVPGAEQRPLTDLLIDAMAATSVMRSPRPNLAVTLDVVGKWMKLHADPEAFKAAWDDWLKAEAKDQAAIAAGATGSAARKARLNSTIGKLTGSVGFTDTRAKLLDILTGKVGPLDQVGADELNAMRLRWGSKPAKVTGPQRAVIEEHAADLVRRGMDPERARIVAEMEVTGDMGKIRSFAHNFRHPDDPNAVTLDTVMAQQDTGVAAQHFASKANYAKRGNEVRDAGVLVDKALGKAEWPPEVDSALKQLADHLGVEHRPLRPLPETTPGHAVQAISWGSAKGELAAVDKRVIEFYRRRALKAALAKDGPDLEGIDAAVRGYNAPLLDHGKGSMEVNILQTPEGKPLLDASGRKIRYVADGGSIDVAKQNQAFWENVAKKVRSGKLDPEKAVNDYFDMMVGRLRATEEAQLMHGSALRLAASPGGKKLEDNAWQTFMDGKAALHGDGTKLLQSTPTKRGMQTLGYTEMAADGHQIITLFKDANLGTLVHEQAHVLRRMGIPEKDLAMLEARYGVKGGGQTIVRDATGALKQGGKYLEGNWTRRQEEHFAKDMERYFRTGTAPIPELEGAFAQVKQALTELWQRFRITQTGKSLDPDIRAMFDEWFSGGQVAPAGVTDLAPLEGMGARSVGVANTVTPERYSPRLLSPEAQAEAGRNAGKNLGDGHPLVQAESGFGLPRDPQTRLADSTAQLTPEGNPKWDTNVTRVGSTYAATTERDLANARFAQEVQGLQDADGNPLLHLWDDATDGAAGPHARFDKIDIKVTELDPTTGEPMKVFRSFAVPKEISHDFKRITQVMNNPGALQHFVKGFDKYMTLWKAYATVPLPFGLGFMLRNMYGNFFNASYLLGTPVGAFKKAQEIQWQMHRGFKDAGDILHYLPEGSAERRWVQGAIDNNIIESGFYETDLGANSAFDLLRPGEKAPRGWGKGNPLSPKFLPLEKGREMNSAIEHNARLGAYIGQMGKGFSSEEAASLVRKYLFDYGDLSEVDRLVKKISPFWTFTRKNTPLQIQQVFRTPGKYAAIEHFRRALMEQSGPYDPQSMPLWMKQSEGIVLPKAASDAAAAAGIGQKGDAAVWMPDFPNYAAQDALAPLRDLKGVVSGQPAGLEDFTRSLINTLGIGGFPGGIAKTGMELALGKEAFSGRPFYPGEQVPTPAYLKPLEALGIVGPTVDRAKMYALEQAMPLFPKIRGTAPTDPADKDKFMRRLLSIFTGQGIWPLGDSTRRGEFLRRTQELDRTRTDLQNSGVYLPDAPVNRKTKAKARAALPKAPWEK